MDQELVSHVLSELVGICLFLLNFCLRGILRNLVLTGDKGSKL